jgi:hypothetical protein
MFRKNRERFERLEKSNERLEKMIEELARHVTAPPAEPAINATAVLADAFGKVAGNQTELFSAMSDLALKSAARRMGIRGGTKRALTAERQANGKFAVAKRLRAPRRSDCRLCDDPMIRDPQIFEIQEHRKHEQQRETGYRNDARSEDSATDQSESVGSGPYQNGSAPS